MNSIPPSGFTSTITWGDPGSSDRRIMRPAFANRSVKSSLRKVLTIEPSRSGWYTKKKLSAVPQMSLPAPDTFHSVLGARWTPPGTPTAPISVHCHGAGGRTIGGCACATEAAHRAAHDPMTAASFLNIVEYSSTAERLGRCRNSYAVERRNRRARTASEADEPQLVRKTLDRVELVLNT